jgi:hypothetical protein
VNPALEAVAQTQPELARELEAGWTTPVGQWSAALWEPFDSPGFEPAFRRALVTELQGRAADPEALVADIERSGAVLTPHHVCPTNGPTFGAIDVVAAAGNPGPMLVLAWSGVPMSNTAASGALCFREAAYDALLRPGTPELARQKQAAKDRERDGVTERRVVLIPPELRDALVYECPLPVRLGDVLGAATPALRALLPDPAPGERYGSWAVRTCERVERALLGREDLWYVDLNRVAARYLVEVLADPDHPVSRLVAAPVEVPGLSWWYTRRPAKRESVETLPAAVDGLRDKLAAGEVCPGLVPVFGALRLLSRIRLLGGFRQVQYLEEIAGAWLRAGVVDEDRGVPGRLVTGRLRAHPLDLVLGAADRGLLPGPDAPMSVVWEPILARLAGS